MTNQIINAAHLAVGYSYSYSISNGYVKSHSALFGILFFIGILVAILMIVSLWKVFMKAGKPGWAAIIPFYQTYILFEVAGYAGWIGLVVAILPNLSLGFHSQAISSTLDVIYFIIYIFIAIKLAQRFGKSVAFAIFGLIIFFFVGWPMLAFGDAKYKPLPGGAKPTPPSAPAPGGPTSA